VLDAGDWTGRLRAFRRLTGHAPFRALRTPWPALRVPSLPRVRLPGVRLPGVRLAGLPRPGTVAAAATWAVAGIALFTVFLHMSRTAPVNSDGASNALQAWQMLHGNPLLRGWQLSDVSFYTTELPQYVLLEALRGLTPDVVHLAGAMTYTLVVLGTALLARGPARGRAGAWRALLAGGIMAAPQASGGVYVLMLSPDHTGSTVPVLAAWILLDRAPRRWWVPAAAGLLLAWGLAADSVVLITGAGPLAAVAAARAYQVGVRHRAGLRAAWFELALVAAAAGAVAAAHLVTARISGAGGFYVWPVDNQVAALSQLGGNLALTVQGTLLLFGANVLGQTAGYVTALAALHLAGLGLAAWAVAAALRRLPRTGLASQLLAAGVVLSLAAYLLGQNALDLHSTREFVAVLPLSAALAGRLLAGRLHAARLTPALALAATGYLLSMGHVIAQAPAPAQGSQLAAWLSAQHLTYGLGGYWQANVITLQTGGRVCVRAVVDDGAVLSRDAWEAEPAWYDPARHQADFVVFSQAGPGTPPPGFLARVRATFGQPARVSYVGQYAVLVWNKNLLTELRP
jgi:hypothetical protein